MFKHLFLLLFSIPAFAAPPCYPGDPTSDGPIPSTVFNGTGACAVWFCDVGNKWRYQAICGTWAEASQRTVDAWKALLDKPSAEKDALWAATFNVPIVPGSPDDLLAKMAAATKTPAVAPPSGRVTQDTKAYKQSPASNSYRLVQVGTVPLGKSCGTTYVTDSAGQRYYALADRFQALMTKVGGFQVPYPTTVYAVCE